jgi:hypothetical protein
MTSGVGWPKVLPRPALISAICGRQLSSSKDEDEVRLP